VRRSPPDGSDASTSGSPPQREREREREREMQPDVWAQLEALPPGTFAEEHGFEFHIRHHKIYIGDPTRSKSENLETVLRHLVKT
jgi:hypothetical protein